MNGHAISMLGTGLIGEFYTNTIQSQRAQCQAGCHQQGTGSGGR